MNEKSHKAILVIDMLNDFADPKGKLYCATAEQVIPKIRQVVEAGINRIPVFYLNDAHVKGDRELEIWGEHALRGTWGAEVVAQLRPYVAQSEIVEKRWYSGFTETDLNERLKKLGTQTVYITGMHTNICDRHTCHDAYVNGYDIVVISDATGTFTEEEHADGLSYLKTMYGAKVMAADAVVKDFEL